MVKQRQALIVLGMHRSGTSALTRVLSLCGANLPKTLMEPKKDNETGFWESEKIMLLNNEILAALNSSWKDTSLLPNGWNGLESIQKYKHQIVELIHDEFDDSAFFVIKDPRICRLLPIWCEALAVLDIEPLFVFSIRHPLEVAASLRKRDGISESQSLLLWLQHFLVAERETRQSKRAFTNYERLLENWQYEIAKVFFELDLTLPDFENSTQKEHDIDNFLSSRLKHHTIASDPSTISSLSTWISKAFKWLIEAGKTDAVEPDFSILDGVYREYADSDKAFSNIIRELQDSEQRSIARLASIKTQFETESGAIQLQLTEAKAELTEAKAELTETKAELAETKAELAEAKAELANTQKQLIKIESDTLHVIQTLQLQLGEAQSNWDTSLNVIKGMESSKFWKVRNYWMRLKQSIQSKH